MSKGLRLRYRAESWLRDAAAISVFGLAFMAIAVIMLVTYLLP